MDWPTDPVPQRLRVPLFPLPNVVLFPGAILPLHIFEPRYKRMTADALEGDARIAIALLRPGWEKSYYQRPAIEPVICTGRIVAHEKLADGNYNFLLQGQWRAKVIDETSSGGETPYRMASAVPLPLTPAMEIDLLSHRHRLVQLFSDSALGANGLGRQFSRLLASPMSTSEIIDLIAFNYFDEVPLKQSLLADGDTCARVARVVSALAERQKSSHFPKHPSARDASMN